MKNGSMFGNLDKINTGEIFTILKGTQVYTYEVVDKNIRHDTDVIYSLENPYYFDCIVLSTCKGKEDRLTLTLKQR
jgi:LPXTG-site transpeptidase (sortase) family protein